MNLVDLFAGAGGLSCGLEMAGFKPVFANEIKQAYAQTYQLNHPETKVSVSDLRDLVKTGTFEQIKEQYGHISLLAGGPPCQGFSINAPVRSLDDDRNQLFRPFMDVAAILQPDTILIENVPGMVSLGRGAVVREIYGELERLGYRVRHKILFAAHYGVPQLRFRMVFLAVKKDIGQELHHPFPQYAAQARANFTGAKELCFHIGSIFASGLKDHTTVWEAISDLPEIEGGQKNGDFDYQVAPKNEYQVYSRQNASSIKNHYANRIAEINRQRLRHIPQGGSWRDIPFDLLPAGLKRAKRSDHTKRYGRLSPDGLCSTILTKCDPHWGSFFHPTQDRVLSVREAARIQSFPDRYEFLGTITQQYEQIGNAVPPLMAKAVGDEIFSVLADTYEAETRLS